MRSATLFVLALAACARDADSGSTGDTTPVDTSPGDDSGGDTAWSTPEIVAVDPTADATDVPVNASISALFSEPMDPSTVGGTTFTLATEDPAVTVDGTVIYSDDVAVFWPGGHLSGDTEYTATVTDAARSAHGVPVAADVSWSFRTGTTVQPGLPVNLGTAGNFVILSKSGISTVPTSAITGDIGVSPAAATYITGFSLTADSTNVFSTSSQVTGRVFAADYAPPTPSNMTLAVGDMELAFTDAAGRAPDATELGAGDVGGMTLASGVYKWGTGLLIPTDVTLAGSETDVWIFEVAQDLTVSSGARVILSGGAVPQNIFWQVSGLVDLGTTSHLEGVVLTQTSVTLRTGATVNGRLLAQTAVDVDGATVVQP